MKTFPDFEKEIKSGKIRNVYFIISSDNYFINKAAELMREKVFGSKDSRDNYFIKYADETPIQELTDLSNNYSSLFAQKKIILLKRCEKYSRKVDELFEFLKAPDPDTILLVCFDKEYISEKKMAKGVDFYDFSIMPEAAVKDWIRKEFKSYGKEINDDALELMIDTFPESYDVLYSEINKISTYEPESENLIDKNTIHKFTGYETDFTPNDLMKAIIRNDSVKAVQILDNLTHKAGLNEIYLVSIISNYYLDLLSFKSGKFRGSDNYSLFGKYKMWGERLNFAKEYANTLKIQDLNKAIELLLELDKKLKTSMLNSDILLTSLVEELSNL